jgi:hypothetical protein
MRRRKSRRNKRKSTFVTDSSLEEKVDLDESNNELIRKSFKKPH